MKIFETSTTASFYFTYYHPEFEYNNTYNKYKRGDRCFL